MTQKDQLRILVWNANGILQQTQEFEVLLRTYGIDIAIICETHLQETKRLHILGYSIYRTDRKHNRGGEGMGTAVLVKNYLPHYRADIQDTENLKATAVGINTKKEPIIFVAVYNHPNKTLLKCDLDQVTVTGNYLLGGDLNNILDIVLNNLKISPETLLVLQELDYDHNPLLCEWDVNIYHQKNWHKPITKTTDWVKYKTDLQELLPRNLQIETEEDVEVAKALFTTTIQETYKTHTMTSKKY
uniref:Endonuclease/exonuclease/phosphatase domain-containing protein n=1 Tax=Timema genevievae TaxID=629358 RepID=A0A7R9PM73_TIMGE|nr:unnamed protein product [Timema genevievae]